MLQHFIKKDYCRKQVVANGQKLTGIDIAKKHKAAPFKLTSNAPLPIAILKPINTILCEAIATTGVSLIKILLVKF